MTRLSALMIALVICQHMSASRPEGHNTDRECVSACLGCHDKALSVDAHTSHMSTLPKLMSSCRQHRDQPGRALNVILDISLHVWHVMTRLSRVNASMSHYFTFCHTHMHIFTHSSLTHVNTTEFISGLRAARESPDRDSACLGFHDKSL